MPDPRLDGIVTDLLRERDGEQSVPQRLCEACVEALPVTAAALTLANEDGVHLLLGATDARARALEDLQFSLGEGPALDASQAGGPVLVSDLYDRQGTTRWPAYLREAMELNLCGQFSFPLQIGAIRLGVLTLYRDQTGLLSDTDMAHALAFADAATIVLLHLQDVSNGDGDLPRDLGTQFDMTAELHQATGMVSVQAAVGMVEALLLLRASAFSSNRTAVTVARDVVAGALNFRNEMDQDEDEQSE
jgi:GAF domain